MNSSLEQPEPHFHRLRRVLLLIALPVVLHLVCIRPAEPVFGGDSNRHVVTSIFFRDLVTDTVTTHHLPNPKVYAEQYYEQYPALGLLVWPPLFHGVCGMLMLVFGTSAEVARWMVLVSFIISCWCVYRMVRRVVDADRASVVMILYSVTPLIFDYSRDIMLEMPALALVMLSVDQFDLWLRGTRPRHLYFAAITAALGALTRFDAAVLLPFYLGMFLLRGGWLKLVSRHALIASAIAIALVGPVYLVIMKEMGDLHLRQAMESVGGSHDGTANSFMAVKAIWFYPVSLVEQSGWPVAVLCVLGFLISLRREQRQERAVFVALMIATYVTFSPLAELRPRHAIYWMPCVAFFAVTGLDVILNLLSRKFSGERLGVSPPCSTGSSSPCPYPPGMTQGPNAQLAVGAYALLFASTAFGSMQLPTYRVEGYAEAAAEVLSQTARGDRIFFDGWWDGNFTYHMRHLDSTRSRSVIRGDKLLYDFVCVPLTDFHKYVENDREIVAKFLEAQPKFVVLENPQFYQTIPVAEQLRQLVKAHPEIFELVDQIPVKSSTAHQKPFHIDIHRFNPDAAKHWLEEVPISKSE
jgi:hypothetical protein